MLLKQEELPRLPEETGQDELKFPDLGENLSNPNYEQTMALEAHVIVIIAPLIEGSSESDEVLLARLEDKIKAIEQLKDVR